MPTDRSIVAVRLGHRPGSDDAGLSMLEMIVAMAVIGTVMTAMAPFLIQSMVVVGEQRVEQVAVEVTTNALERVRALTPSSLLVGRTAAAVQTQWNNAPDAVKAYETLMTREPGPTDPTAGASAGLPTTAQDVLVGGATYTRQWYVGRCWQPKADPAASPAIMATCSATENAAYVPFFRVVVAVSWKVSANIDRGPCTRGACVYVATTLLSTGTDMVYDLKRAAPTVTPPGNQKAYVSVVTSLQLAATGGWLPRTWKATGLPAGLSLTASTGAITGTATTAGSYPVTVLVTDRDKVSDDATFTWTVTALPSLAIPADQTSRVGTPGSLPITVAGGYSAYAWTATGLPAGLTVNATTGVISGTPTTESKTMKPVKIDVVDSGGKTATVTFGWRVLTPVQVTSVPTQTFPSGSSAGGFSVPVSGGLGPYTWTATGLPDGFTMNTAGAVNGIATNGTRYVVTAVATDSAGGTGSVVVVCDVTPQGTDLRIASPLADRTNPVGATVSGTASATNGATGARTWSAAGLPPGVTFSTAGVLGGQPTTAGKYIPKLTARDTAGKIANSMFVWTVTP